MSVTFWYPIVAVDSQQWLFKADQLPNFTLSISWFQSRVVINYCQKKVLIRWLLTLFKSAENIKVFGIFVNALLE